MLGRLVGWDTRLSAAVKERTDMQQQRDGETLRARLTESRFAALKEKTGLLISILSINFRLEREPLVKLQTEVRRLQDRLEAKRQSRLELSESILQESRSRLDSATNSVCRKCCLPRVVFLNHHQRVGLSARLGAVGGCIARPVESHSQN
jgi:hypothetical protein